MFKKVLGETKYDKKSIIKKKIGRKVFFPIAYFSDIDFSEIEAILNVIQVRNNRH